MATYNSIQDISSVTIRDEYLSNIIAGYMPEGFIADQIFLPVPTVIDYARIPRFNSPLSINADLQLSPSGFPTMTLNFSAAEYYQLKTRGLQTFIGPAEKQQFGSEARAQGIVNEIIDRNLKLTREYGIANTIMNASVMLQTFASDVAWDDYVNSDPIADFRKARETVMSGILSYTGCGKEANVAILGWKVYNTLISHPQLIKAWLGPITAGDNFMLTEVQLAKVMGVKKILVGKSMYDSALEGQTASRCFIWPDYCLFAYITEELRPNEAVQSLGYQFIPSDISTQGYPEFTYLWTPQGITPDMGKYLTRGHKFDDHLMDYTCGALITGLITT